MSTDHFVRVEGQRTMIELPMISGSSLPTLTTGRLTMRWLTPADVPALFEIFSDPVVTRYWSTPPLPDLAAAERLLARIEACFQARTLFQWGVARRTDNGVIGTCTLASLSPEHRRAELGYALGRAYWGQGYMAEALPALLRYAFSTLRLHRIEADVDPRNGASIRSLERLGFRREGYLRERYHLNGEFQDAVLYGLLRSEVDLALDECEAPTERSASAVPGANSAAHDRDHSG
jgi:ribosomal-protein-alanine N-acetyltransferase